MEIIDFNQYIDIKLAFLIPVLNIIGYFIKKSEIINNKHIPLILGVISIILTISWFVIIVGENISHAIILGIIQGLLYAGASVYGHNIAKNYTQIK